MNADELVITKDKLTQLDDELEPLLEGISNAVLILNYPDKKSTVHFVPVKRAMNGRDMRIAVKELHRNYRIMKAQRRKE